MTRKAIIAGSFDPITNGHLDLITRTARLFDEVYVAIGKNPDKKCLFTVDERKSFIKNALTDYGNVVALEFDGLLSEFAYSLNVDCIVRGIRSSSDYEVEKTLSSVNKNIKGIETLFMPCSDEYTSVSSTIVKAIVKESGFVHELVPLEVKAALEQRILGRKYFGITGGSGSGKSTLAEDILAKASALGPINFKVLHIDLDKFAHEIYNGNEPYEMACKESMGIYFGREIFNDDMTINRKELSNRVFSNSRDLAVLNEIMKKPIYHKFYERVRESDADLILVDGAILIETKMTDLVNNNCILVSCDEDKAIERIMHRDNISLTYARSRIESQPSSNYRINRFDELINKSNFGRKIEVDSTDSIDVGKIYEDIIKDT